MSLRTAGNQGSWSPFDTQGILTETVGRGSYLQRDTAHILRGAEMERDRVAQRGERAKQRRCSAEPGSAGRPVVSKT